MRGVGLSASVSASVSVSTVSVSRDADVVLTPQAEAIGRLRPLRGIG